MKNIDKIKKALVAKDYIPGSIEFETIRYYSTGREGGWNVSVFVDDNDYCFPDWSKVILPKGLIADIFENDFFCYNITDVLKVIELLPGYNSNRSTYDN